LFVSPLWLDGGAGFDVGPPPDLVVDFAAFLLWPPRLLRMPLVSRRFAKGSWPAGLRERRRASGGGELAIKLLGLEDSAGFAVGASLDFVAESIAFLLRSPLPAPLSLASPCCRPRVAGGGELGIELLGLEDSAGLDVGEPLGLVTESIALVLQRAPMSLASRRSVAGTWPAGWSGRRRVAGGGALDIELLGLEGSFGFAVGAPLDFVVAILLCRPLSVSVTLFVGSTDKHCWGGPAVDECRLIEGRDGVKYGGTIGHVSGMGIGVDKSNATSVDCPGGRDVAHNLGIAGLGSVGIVGGSLLELVADPTLLLLPEAVPNGRIVVARVVGCGKLVITGLGSEGFEAGARLKLAAESLSLSLPETVPNGRVVGARVAGCGKLGTGGLDSEGFAGGSPLELAAKSVPLLLPEAVPNGRIVAAS
jgi:hypothetical protein